MYLCVCIPELCAIHFLDAVVHVSLCRVYLYVICADDCERVSVSCIDASVIIGPAAIAGPDRAKNLHTYTVSDSANPLLFKTYFVCWILYFYLFLKGKFTKNRNSVILWLFIQAHVMLSVL